MQLKETLKKGSVTFCIFRLEKLIHGKNEIASNNYYFEINNRKVFYIM